MAAHREDKLFQRYRKTGDPDCLAEVFDRTAPTLLRNALHLARDPVAAEDLLQATFLTAIQKSETYDGKRPLLPWLTGILTRHAARVREQQARCPDPDKLPRETHADPASDAEGREFAELLRKGVEQLPEEYRQVLLLKLLHGLQPAEIAEVLGVPPGTIRMRLHRGMEKLRRILPVGLALAAGPTLALRGLSGVRQAVLKRATLPSSALVPIGTALLMKKLLVPAVVAAGLAALWLAWPVLPTNASVPPNANPQSGPLTATSWGDQPAGDVESVGASDRTSLASRGIDAPENGSLLLQVRHEATGRPAPNVGVFLTPLDGRDPVLNERRGVTDASGGLLVEDLPPGPVQVKLDRLVETTVRIAAGEQSRHELLIPIGVTVKGKVVDQHGGRVPFADIWIRQGSIGWRSSMVTTANAFGEFLLEDVSIYTHVGASAPGHAPSYMHSVLADLGGTVELEIALEGLGAVVVGRVLDSSGSPVPNALILVGGDFGGRSKRVARGETLQGWGARRVRTSEEGSFQVQSLPPGWLLLNVRAPGKAPYSQYFELVSGKLNEVIIELRDGVDLAGRVLDSVGNSISGARIALEAYGLYERMSTVSGPDGSYHLQGISAERIKMEISAAGYTTRTELLQAEPGTELQWDFQLDEIALLRGRLVSPDEEPLLGWRVQVDDTRSGTGTTDREGRFEIPWQRDEPGQLRVAQTQSGSWIRCTWLGDVQPGKEELIIRIPAEFIPRSHIRGFLLEADGSPVADEYVILFHASRAGRRYFIDPASGAFEIGPLTAGAYWLEVGWVWDGRPPTFLGPYRIRNGDDLDLGELRLDQPGRVSVSISSRDGSALVDPYVFFWDSGGHELVGAYVDEAGTCSESLRPGSYRVKVMTNNTAWATRSFEIRSGEETELALVLDPTVRRYISFPVPEPEGWEGVGVFRYVLRDATGMVLDEGDFDARRWGIPYRYAPALAVGTFSMELILDDGRRYGGAFEVPDLRPSQIPIKIRVTPLR